MKIRLQATRYIWVAYALTMVTMFMSLVFTGNPLSAGYVVIATAASIMAFVSTGTVWNWGDLDDDDDDAEDEAYDKRKRRHPVKLERIMSRLSDEERAELRERLDEDTMRYGLSDDGEIVEFKR